MLVELMTYKISQLQIYDNYVCVKFLLLSFFSRRLRFPLNINLKLLPDIIYSPFLHLYGFIIFLPLPFQTYFSFLKLNFTNTIYHPHSFCFLQPHKNSNFIDNDAKWASQTLLCASFNVPSDSVFSISIIYHYHIKHTRINHASTHRYTSVEAVALKNPALLGLVTVIVRLDFTPDLDPPGNQGLFL